MNKVLTNHNTIFFTNRAHLGILAAAILVLPALTVAAQNAYGHVLQECTTSSADQPAGILLKVTGSERIVWVAYSGTNKLYAYPNNNCALGETINLELQEPNFDPLHIANTDNSRILITSLNWNKIVVFDTATDTVIDDKSWSSLHPWDIAQDPADPARAWFTADNTNKIGRILSTGSLTTNTYSFPGLNVGKAKGVVVDSTNVYFTDIGQDKIWKRDKATGTYTSRDIIEGDSYGIMVDTTNGQLFFPAYQVKKLINLPSSFTSTTPYTLYNGHSTGTDGQPAIGMYRVANANTDACVTYKDSGHTGCIHIQGLPEFHDADFIGGSPQNAVYDTAIVPNQQIGTHATSQHSGTTADEVDIMTHFPG